MDSERLTPDASPTRRDCPRFSLDRARALIDEELSRATAKFGPFLTPEEGWAVLEEEIDELWDEIKTKEDAHADGFYGRNAAIVCEAVQVGAMALRYLRDCFPHAMPWLLFCSYGRRLTSLHDAYGLIRTIHASCTEEARAQAIYRIALSILTDLCYDI